MVLNAWRRTVAAVALCASAALLAACGSSTTESQLSPARIVSFGDAFSDVGQASGQRYTVNDGTTNHWLLQLASRYGQTLAPSSAGGTGFAQASGRIAAKPDPAGSSSTQTVTEQIDAFLAAGGVFGGNDLVVLNGGMADVVAEGKAFLAGSQTEDQMVANLQTAASQLATQARRVVAAGARYVVVVGTINLGITPWAQSTVNPGALQNASLKFNERFLVDVVEMGDNLLYVDAAYYFNLAGSSDSAGSFGLSNARDVVCTSVDAGAGIGLGAGRVNSALCTTSTVTDANYNAYMFADELYATPNLQRLFGDYTYERIRNRW